MFLLGILMAVFGGIAYRKNKGIDLITLFCFIWMIVFLSASFKLYGMREYKLSTVILFALGSLSFILFGYIGRYGKYRKVRIKSKLTDPNAELNKLIFEFFLSVLTAFVVYLLLRMVTLIAAGIPLGTIHAMYLGRGNEAFFTNYILSQLHSKFIIPFIYCLAPIIIYLILKNVKENLLFIIIGFIDLVGYMIATGSRIIFIFMLTDMLLMLSFTRIKLSVQAFRKIKKIGLFIVAILIMALVAFTISRKGFRTSNENSVFSQIFGEVYKYFSLCIPLTDYWLLNIDNANIITYGKMSSYGLLSLVEWLKVFLFNSNTFEWLDICKDLASKVEIMIPIFKDAQCNAFVTYIFYFYVDFGIIGIGILSSLWGFLCGRISKKLKQERTEKITLFYLLFAQTVSMSFSRWSFFDAPYFLAYLYMMLLFLNIKKKVKLI